MYLYFKVSCSSKFLKYVILFRKYQQRFPNELLCGLAECLLDNTVFGIVEHLMDIQHYTEKQLFKKRLRFIHDHSGKVQS